MDGYLLTAPVAKVVADGKQNDVPTLTGANLGELGGISGPPAAVTVESFVRRATQRYGADGRGIPEAVPRHDRRTGCSGTVTEQPRSGARVDVPVGEAAARRTAKTKAFTYLWDHAIPGPDAARYGAFHTSEVPYCMNTLDMSDRPFTDADHKIADMMSSYVANFVKTGDPNGKGLPRWDSGWRHARGHGGRRQDGTRPARRRRGEVRVLREISDHARGPSAIGRRIRAR